MRISGMKKLLLIIVTVVGCLSAAATPAKNSNFMAQEPQQAAAQAERDLDDALKKGQSSLAVNALVRLSIAKSFYGPDSIAPALARVQEMRARVKGVDMKALLTLLEARIYTEIYNGEKWRIDSRATLASEGSDFTLWSRAQYFDRVSSLLREVLADAPKLLERPLIEFRDAITFRKEALTFYPTLWDFAAYQSIALLECFDDASTSLPSALLFHPTDTSLFPSYKGSVTREILNFYLRLMQGRENQAPGVMALRNEMEFIAERIFVPQNPEFSFAKTPDRKAVTRFEAFVDAYCRMAPASDYAVELLLAATQGGEGENNATMAYEMLQAFKRDHPKYFNINEVTNRLAQMSQSEISVEVPSQCALGKPLKVKVKAKNSSLVTIGLYRVPTTWDRNRNRYSSRQSLSNPVTTMDVVLEGTVPFSAEATTELELPGYGRYIVAPVTKRRGSEEQSWPITVCSDISAAFLTTADITDAVTVDATTGAPLQGTQLQFKAWTRLNPLETFPGVTDKEGFLKLPLTEQGMLYPVRGDDRYNFGVEVWKDEKRSERPASFAEIFTPLGLYHFGDMVKWAGVVYQTSPSGRSVVPSREVKVRLRSADYREVDRCTVTTDASGRFTGSFRLPLTGVSGNYTLQVEGDSTLNSVSQHFMVSDYKLPTFMVNISSVRSPVRPDDDAVIRGNASTFAGFPVEEGKITLQLRVRTQVGWFGSVSPVFYQLEGTTGPKGDFTLTVPGEVIAASPAPTGYFMAEVAVTSPDGETRSASTGFNLGHPLTIEAEIPPVFDAIQPPAARVWASDAEGEEVPLKLRYLLQRVNGPEGVWTTDSGTCSTGSISRLIARLPSGSYRVIFAPQDGSQAYPTLPQSFTVWRRTDSQSPSDNLLWLPEERVVANSKGKAFLTFATPLQAGDAWVLLTLSDSKGNLVMRRWVQSRGMTRVELPLPQGVEELSGKLWIVNGCESASRSFTLQTPSMQGKIEVKMATFRNKVVPGEEEELKLTVRGLHGASPASSVMMSMTDKAIDLLNPASLDFTPRNYPSIPTRMWGFSFGNRNINIYSNLELKETPQIIVPDLETYGMNFGGLGYGVYAGGVSGGVVKSKMAAGRRVAEANTIVVGYGVRDMKIRGRMMEDANEAMAEAAPAMASNSDMGAKSADGQEAYSPKAMLSDSNYRPSEIPLAFFRPMLSTDSLGNLEVKYTVPNANTTWVLRFLAWNGSLLTGSDKVEIVSSKPVMVNANAPRFLRCGDTVGLLASVMNARTSASSVATLCELVDLSTGRVLATASSTDSIPSMERRVVKVPFTVPSNVNSLIFRVRSTSGSYSDGEQVLIPVLPSEQNVTESHNFYISPSQRSFQMPLAPIGEGRAYISFTENPTWEVVSALPGLRSSEQLSSSSISAAAALFSACVADGLMRSYPEVAMAVRRWAEHPSDSALVSMLEKNTQLKDVLLSATPWVADALSQTERMERLVLLLDSRNTAKAVETSIDDLAKTFNSAAGSWCWCKEYTRPSQWATGIVLSILGNLNRMGWLPADKRLNSMMEKAVTTLDKEAASAFAAYPKDDYTPYAFMRMKFPNVKQSSASSAVVKAAVRRCIDTWKGASVTQNAVDAMILNANGYNATARRILESLTQRATSTMAEGMWWTSLNGTLFGSYNKVASTALILEAYHAVNPSAPEIDKIRQWLVLNKSNNDWGNSVITSQVVASVLATGSKWTVNPSATAIRIGGELLTPPQEFAIGAFVEPVTRLLQDSTLLTVDRQGGYPSFGGVMTMRTLPMSEVTPVGSTQLDINKALYVWNGEAWNPTSAFRLGDRVKVVLTLHVRTDMSYVVVTDPRAAGLEPVEQLPTPVWSEGLLFYRENRNSSTNLFIERLPKGTYRLEYELFAGQSGTFSSGVASIQSLYNPLQTAHSAGATLTVE